MITAKRFHSSSAELVNQTLHIVPPYNETTPVPFEHSVAYKWGEWIILSDCGTIYVINNTDKHQSLILSPFESGFVFYATDKNPNSYNKVIVYPPNDG